MDKDHSVLSKKEVLKHLNNDRERLIMDLKGLHAKILLVDEQIRIITKS